jgi:parallel beta-helix repeat protein
MQTIVGDAPADLVVKACEFALCLPGKPSGPEEIHPDLQANPIYVSRPQPAATPAMPPIHQNVIFAENFVHQVPGAGFYIAASNNILLYRNTLSNTNFESLPNTFNQAPDTGFPILINDASNVWITRTQLPE